MVNITHKNSSLRKAVATAILTVSKQSTIDAIQDRKVPKGDVFEFSRAAGLLGIKKTSDVIHGNFEKFIVSRDGSKYVRFCNSDLLDMAYTSGNRDVSPEEALKNIKKTIEDFIQEEYDENNIN